MFADSILIIYTIAFSVVLLFSIGQAALVFFYLKNKRRSKNKDQNNSNKDLPFVTVQLPIFNELYVVERLIDAVAQFDYPKDKLEIQVLDDSTDETKLLIADKTRYWQNLGIDIKHVTREKNTGFKAGALQNGLLTAKGEFIAIFDADFIPAKDFLSKEILQPFENSEIGMVQARWEHLNSSYSLLTRVQAFGLNAHFSIEQAGRNSEGLLMNFNGTAGVWRKTCIEDAGGWQHDTLTEDLDLSYRAQLQGWKFKYIEQQSTPAELPVEMNAIKSQQFRWTKGAIETSKKMIFPIWKSNILFKQKIFATLHLLNSYGFLFAFVTGIFSVPLLIIKNTHEGYELFFKWLSVFLIAFLIIIIFYLVASLQNHKPKWKAILKFLVMFPVFLSISMGMTYQNTKAVILGIIGKRTPFIRTPKFNILKNSDHFNTNKYLNHKLYGGVVIEIILAFYYLFAIIASIYYLDFGLIVFHIMLFLGFLIISIYSIAHSRVHS